VSAMQAGRLRHRVKIQYPAETQDPETGAINVVWTDLATVWAAIEPLSARDFVAAEAEQSKVTARIVIRYRADITAKMRIYYPAKKGFYKIDGDLADKDSGLEYLTLVVSTIASELV